MSEPRRRRGGGSAFDRFDLDPRAAPGEITERLRELAEETADPALRQEIRDAWEELTLHPLRRLDAALDAHPESRAPLGAPPPRTPIVIDDAPLDLPDLVPRPRIGDLLAPPTPEERAVLGAPGPSMPRRT